MKLAQYGVYSFVSSSSTWPCVQTYSSWSTNRQNGNFQDCEGRACPHDGESRWIKGSPGTAWAHGVPEEDGRFHYEVHYFPGPQDLAWAAEIDRQYLMRLLWGDSRQLIPDSQPDATILQKQEPAVWFLWQADGNPADIGAWWLTKLQLPNIRDLVQQAQTAYQAQAPQPRM